MIYNCVLVRFSGEFGVKSLQTQNYMETLLRSNIKSGLNASGNEELLKRLNIISRQGRYYLALKQPTDKEIEALISIVGRSFGVSSVSPCFQTSVKDPMTIKTIPAKLMLAYEIYPSKIEIKILDKKSGIDEKKWKDYINNLCEKFSQGKDSKVSILRFHSAKNWDMGPWMYCREKKLEIEVFENNAYITAEKIKSPGGFPLGLEDPLVALISGGIDSPVAAWMAMKRGAPLIMVIMDSTEGSARPPPKGASVKEKALMEAKILLEYMKGYPSPKIFIVPYGKALNELAKAGSYEGITCLLCKRFMYKVAENIAQIYGAKGIITGEILGEQASQTAQNLMVLNEITKIPVHRPLFGFDKIEVIDKAKHIGTDKLFSLSQEPCWAVPEHPEVRGSIETIRKAEKNAKTDELIKYCLDNIKQVSVKEIEKMP